MSAAASLFGGSISDCLQSSPGICFASERTRLLLKKRTTLTYPSAVQATMSFESLNIATTAKEVWQFEWLPGETRVCRVKSAHHPSLYWFCADERSKCKDKLYVTPFKKKGGVLQAVVGNKTIFPSTFSLNIVGNSVSIKVNESQLWLSVRRKGEVDLSSSFSEQTQFIICLKVALYTRLPSLLLKNGYRKFLVAAGLLRDYKLVFESVWGGRGYCFLLMPRNGHFLLYSTQGSYCCVASKNKQLVCTGPDEESAARFRIIHHDSEDYELSLQVDVQKSGEFTDVVTHNDCLYIADSPFLEGAEINSEHFFLTFLPERQMEQAINDSNQNQVQEKVPPIELEEAEYCPVFGVKIPVLVEREGMEVPFFLQHSVQYLRHQYESEGLFRLSGSKAVLDETKHALDHGKRLPEIMQITPRIGPDEVAGLLKNWIQNCSLFTPDVLAALQALEANHIEPGEILTVTCGEDVLEYGVHEREEYRKVIHSPDMPKYVRDVFGYLCKFFHGLAQHSAANKMTACFTYKYAHNKWNIATYLGSAVMSTAREVIKSTDMPKDAKVIALILESMGVKEYEPRVLHQFLEFMYRYVTDVLQDAKTYSSHANRDKIELSDVTLAVQSRVNHSFTQPPPREILLELAEKKNSTPLPLISQKLGVLLPREQYCITAPNYQIDPNNTGIIPCGAKRGRGAISDDPMDTNEEEIQPKLPAQPTNKLTNSKPVSFALK